jgi:hypothetical protein
MHPRCTKPKKLSVLHSWRPTKRRKLPSEEPHYIPAPLVTPQLAPVLRLQLPSRLPGAADLLDVLTVVACRRKEGTARIWRASTLG